MATKVLEYELSEGLRDIEVDSRYNNYRFLIRFNHVPISWINIPCPDARVISSQQFSEAVKKHLGYQLLVQSQHNHLSRALQTANSASSCEGISVVVCTRNRTQSLAKCLATLLTLDYTDYEIIVVDNAPTDAETEQLVKDLPVRYVLEERPGLNWARNRGIAEARHDIIAFTDDDAQIDRFWLRAVADTLRNTSVTAVTGLVAPAELETRAQLLFEFGYGGMGHGYRYKTISREKLDECQLIYASGIGIGVNMAFRRSKLIAVGGFDTALDVGTPSSGAGDIEMFYRLLASGHKIAYNPSMLVWHMHRRELSATKKQIMDNGRSFGCFLLTCHRKRGLKLPIVIKYLLIDWLLKWNLKNLIKPPAYFPRILALIELAGMLQSPFAYRSSQLNSKKIANQWGHSPQNNLIDVE